MVFASSIFRLSRVHFDSIEKWKIQTPLFYTAGFIVIVPFIVSLTMYFNYEEKVNPIEVVAIQPNVNPYEK